jgi:hypothetical protein
MHKANRRSYQRFQQFNCLVDSVAGQLPTPTHIAVMLCCFRHGREGGYFRVSTSRLAKSVGLRRRRVQAVLDDLQAAGVIELVSEHNGPVPRVYRFRFTEANGALQCAIRVPSPPI